MPECRKACNEDQAWDAVVPVGREFGSVDFERLMNDDVKQFFLDLRRWIELSSDKSVPHELDVDELSDSRNVQLALHELGEDVTIEVANAVWKNYSQSLMAGWMSGAETVQAAIRSIYLHCPRENYPKY